jgi:hypothetical protein
MVSPRILFYLAIKHSVVVASIAYINNQVMVLMSFLEELSDVVNAITVGLLNS